MRYKIFTFQKVESLNLLFAFTLHPSIMSTPEASSSRAPGAGMAEVSL